MKGGEEMELRRFRMKGKNDPGEFFAWCAKKGLSREDLMLILALVELDTSVGALPAYLHKEESESVGQMKFETYLQSVLTDAQIHCFVRENRLRERGYVVMLASCFATPVEAKNAAIHISERIAAEEGVFVVMELT